MLSAGKKIPFKYRLYGEEAEKDIYDKGKSIGSSAKSIFRKMKEPTNEELHFMNFCLNDTTANRMTFEQV